MKAQFECSKLDETRSLVLLELDLDSFDAPWHFHPALELTYIIEGSGERFVGDSVEPFAAGDLVLLGSKVPHYWQSDAGENFAKDEVTALASASPPPRSKAIVFHFRENFVDSYPEFRDVGQLLHRKCSGGLKFEPNFEIKERIENFPNHDQRFRVPKFFELLTLLSSMPFQSLSKIHADARLDMKANHRISKATQYVHLHFARPDLSLVDVAASVEMSPSAFSRYFHRFTGQTLNRFIASKRIARSCMILAETDHPITEVAEQSGFGSLSSFNRQFRRIKKISPRQFRAKHR